MHKGPCATGKKVVCYWQAWSHNRSSPHAYTADDIPIHLCTHVVFSYAKLDNRASSLHLGKEFDAGTDGYFRFLRLKERNPKVKLLLALGDRYGSDHAAWYGAIHDSPRRYHVMGMLYRLLKEYRFDGLHIDWKNALAGEGNSTENGIVKFAWQVQKTFKRFANFTLSCTTVLSKGRGLQAVLRQLVPYVDTFHVSPVGDSTGRVSSNGTNVSWSDLDALYTSVPRAAIGDGLQYLFQSGVPYEKIILEIPFYGLKVPENSQRSEHMIPYYEICDLLRQGVPNKWDEERKSSYLVLDDGVHLYYDDADSVRQKVIFAKWAGLGGVSAWPVNMDNQAGLQKRKNDLLKGIVEGMNEDISLESATQVIEASVAPGRKDIGGISALSVEATQSSSVTEASSARSSILVVTTEKADSRSNHTNSQEIKVVTTQLPSTVSRKYVPLVVEKVTHGLINSKTTLPPPTHTLVTLTSGSEPTSTGTEVPTFSRSSDTIKPVTTDIPHSSSQITTTNEIAESSNYNTTNEFSPHYETPPTPNFESDFSSTGTEAPSHNSDSSMKPVTTIIPDISPRNNPSTQVVGSTNYNTADEFYPHNQTTATSNTEWELTSTIRQAPTHNSGSETMEPATTQLPDGSSGINATTEVGELTKYNTTDEFSPLKETTTTRNFVWELTSTLTQASTHGRSSDTMEPVTTTTMPNDSSRVITTTEVAKSTKYDTADKSSALNQTMATPNFEWELTSTGTQAATHHSSTDTIESETTEIPKDWSRLSTTTEVAESTKHDTPDELSTLNQSTATPNFELELTSAVTQAGTSGSSSDIMDSVTTAIADDLSRVITTTEVAESTKYDTADKLSALNQTMGTPNFEWELRSTGTQAATHHSSTDTIEPETTEIPNDWSRVSTTTEVAESTKYDTTDKLSTLNQSTATPNFEWELKSTVTQAGTLGSSSDIMDSVTTAIPDDLSRVITTTEVAESTKYNTTDKLSALTQTTATTNFEWELTSTGTQAATHHSSTDTIEPETTEIPNDWSSVSTTTEVAESTKYNTTDELSLLNQTTASPNFEWQLTSTGTQAATRGSSSDTTEPATTEMPNDWSRVSTTTEAAESAKYNTSHKFSTLNQATATPNFEWELTSTVTQAGTRGSSSNTIKTVTKAIPDDLSRVYTTTAAAESTKYDTNDEFSVLNQTTATPHSERELTSTAAQVAARRSSSDTMEPATPETPDISSPINTATDVMLETGGPKFQGNHGKRPRCFK
nr:mucin-3A-like [Rhipicephalus microplus]